MRIVGKVLLWVGGVLGVGVLAAAMWFWITPVGINNYVNKITIQLALNSPQTLTQIGVIDNTLLDFHSGKLDDQTKAFEDEMIARLRTARAELDRYGPEGLEGQELLTYQITAWFLDDALRQWDVLKQNSVSLASKQISHTQGINAIENIVARGIINGYDAKRIAERWQRPSFEHDAERSMWSLYNAVTEVFTHEASNHRYEANERKSASVLSAFVTASEHEHSAHHLLDVVDARNN